MQKEKIAIIALVLIIVAALSVFLIAMYYPDILENLFEDKTIEEGDLADVHYIARYASNNTIFDASYLYPENKTGGSPLNVFVTTDSTVEPPEQYTIYSNLIGTDYVEGFIEGLVGLKEGQTATLGPIPPEKAYGIVPKINDVLTLSPIFTGREDDVYLKFVDIQINTTMPIQYESYFGNGTTTVYVLRDESHYIGETIETYSIWPNATIITQINETLLWKYTTPPEELYENLTWSTIDYVRQEQITYPENATKVSSINDSTIILTHMVQINDSIEVLSMTGTQVFLVENYTTDIINAYLQQETTGNKTYRTFNRTVSIERNETQDITVAIPEEYLEIGLLAYLRSEDKTIKYRIGPEADQEFIFEVKIVKVYKPESS